MAAFSLLGIGAALGAGFLLGRKKKKNDQPQLAPAPINKPKERTRKSATERAIATAPPDPIKAASENTQAAGIMAAKVRKRAGAGNAGRVSTGAVSNAQKAIGNAGARPTLGGY